MQIDGNKMLSGCTDGYIKLWDLRTGKCHRNMYGHPVKCPAFSHAAQASVDVLMHLLL